MKTLTPPSPVTEILCYKDDPTKFKLVNYDLSSGVPERQEIDLPNPYYYRRRSPDERPEDMANVIFGLSTSSSLWLAGWYQSEDDGCFCSGEDGYDHKHIKWWAYLYITKADDTDFMAITEKIKAEIKKHFGVDEIAKILREDQV
jgi:hypothetical protein